MRKEKPLVSIVVPCYNHAEFVKETIQSVIDQDYENIELIIIDDGSKDNSVEVIEEMVPACHKRFKRFEFRHRPNRGLCATLNEALEWCTGEYLSCIASDDIMMPYKTSVQVEYLLENPASIGVFGRVELLNTQTGMKAMAIKVIRKVVKYNFDDILLHKHRLPAPTQMLRLESVKRIGGYREDLLIEDWSMWLFLTERGGTLDYLNQLLAVYRSHDDNFSKKHDLMHQGRMQMLDLFAENKKYKAAVAMAILVHAHGVQTVSKKKSLEWVTKAIVNYPFSIFSRSFLWFFIKLFRFK